MSNHARRDPASAFPAALLRDAQDYLAARGRPGGPGTVRDAAWERFYAAYGPIIEAYVARRLRGADASDCVQEVWKDVVTGLSRFCEDPGRGSFEAWLRSVARNKIVDAIRRRARHRFESLAGRDWPASCRPDGDAAAECERCIAHDRVRAALVELSARVPACSYQALYLRSIEGRDVADVAASLGLTPEQVRFRCHRARRKLRELLLDRHAGGLAAAD